MDTLALPTAAGATSLEDVLLALGLLVMIWFGAVFCQRAALARRVRRALDARGGAPAIEQAIGASACANAVAHLERQGLGAVHAAWMLELYVLEGYGRHLAETARTDPIDPREVRFLQALGWSVADR